MELSFGKEAQVLTGLILAIVLKYSATWWMRKRRETLFEKIGQVSALYLYPVKSCKGVKIDEGVCTKYGIRSSGVYDRSFVVVQSDGTFIHQRIYPKMALISVAVKGDNIEFTAPGKSPICIEKEGELDKKNLKQYELHYEEKVPGQDCGDDVAKWVSDFLGVEGLRVGRYIEGMEHRDIHNLTKPWEVASAEGDTAMYSDWAPYLVVNKSSLDFLNTKLEKPLTELSFRPNILLEGPEAFDEDNWLEIKIGEKVRMRCTDACTRCSLTTVDPDKGVKSKDGEPLKTLRTFRKFEQFADSPVFGVNTTPDVLGMVRVGDPVYAIRKK